MKRIEIIKASGKKADFQMQKLVTSLMNAGADIEVANRIAKNIEKRLYDGISTKIIYKMAFDQLKKNGRSTAARYKLKKAIMELGDTGYPFEKFVAALLKSEGFETQVGVIVQGYCVSHEIDVIAENKEFHYACECKFHNHQGRHCSVRIPLYIQSRFKDVEKVWLKQEGHQNKIHQGWIFTNTRFTSDAIQYATCVGLKLISWNFPKDNGIEQWINRLGVHPVTCLTTLKPTEKRRLIALDKILCEDLCNQPQLLNDLKIERNRHQEILSEAKELCTKHK